MLRDTKMNIIKYFLFLLLFSTSYTCAEDIKLSTWNIEHLGTDGRGFGGGFGGGSIDLRTPEQIKTIAEFIKNELKSDIIALQEISIDYEDNGSSRNERLDVIVNELGIHWQYYLPPKHNDHHNQSMYVGYLWNTNKVNAATLAPLITPNLNLAGKALFDRVPVIGYFEVKTASDTSNDFIVVNVHLASGQHNDENHLIAMTLIEYQLGSALKELRVKESDRIILGDFNDNPYAKSSSGKNIHTPALYEHMRFKGYTDFVTEDFHSTRMDSNLKSVIDHVLINKSAINHIDEVKAEIWLPTGGESNFATWRQTFSDHFPISVYINVATSDDDVDWH